jgi:hypothetical protein
MKELVGRVELQEKGLFTALAVIVMVLIGLVFKIRLL